MTAERVRKREILKASTTTQLFSNKESPAYISPDSSVLLIGPGAWVFPELTLPMDCGLIALGEYLDRKKGQLDVLGLPLIRTPEGGCNDIDGLRTTMTQLFRQANSHPPTLHFIKDDVLEYNPPGNKYDVLWDHLTLLDWIIPYQLQKNRSLMTVFQAFGYGITNYLEKLKLGGKIFIFYKNTNQANMFASKLRTETINQMGPFKCTVRRVELVRDLYDISEPLYCVLNNVKRQKEYAITMLVNGQLNPSNKAKGVLVFQKLS